uniref:(R)-citramalate synthase n=1 Tax=Aureoumbra lagunensis TaxID=44058 RepID=A0A7S3NPT1_9STRA|mmetsp:Transcript_3/g.4  ORF Transcript_3/g.4 Transcript_3/m.4 type:complete len:634 (+) Transcript_3:32-1933(+)
MRKAMKGAIILVALLPLSSVSLVFSRSSFSRERVQMQAQVGIYCTTLRDGTQGEGISVSCEDKLRIARRVSEFGIDWIEAGWPGSNPKDQEFFARAKRGELDETTQSKLVAFGSTRRKGLPDPSKDQQLLALVESGCSTVCIVCKASAWQTAKILGASLEENLDMISSSVEWLCKQGMNVHVDLEHYFDGTNNDSYGLDCALVAANAGAEAIILCDTNGGTLPWIIEEKTRLVLEALPSHVQVGIHAHNDAGLAVANSLAAVRGGATIVQGTINGVGERCGNADLCSILPALELKKDVLINQDISTNCQLDHLTDLSRFVDETLNLAHEDSRPYVGASAFAHKGGLHVSAVAKDSRAYEHIEPELVGNAQRVLVSELSGRANIWSALERSGLHDTSNLNSTEAWRVRALEILRDVKALEALGYSFEGAEASVHLLLLHASPGFCPPFKVIDYAIQIADSDLAATPARCLAGDSDHQTARATVKLALAGQQPHLDVAEGRGPVDALAGAFKKALRSTFATVDNIAIADYKVRILDPKSASRAATRVHILFKDIATGKTWTTVGVDRNIISASANALVDGLEYGIIEHADFCYLCDIDDFMPLPQVTTNYLSSSSSPNNEEKSISNGVVAPITAR